MRTAAVLIASLVVCAAGAANALGRGSIVMCKGSQLAGSFKAVPGSAGAGNISYALRLQNVSTSSCSLTGLPQGQLLGRTGAKNPTHVRAAFPGALTAILVTLAPHQSARATARFSPDVPGVGEGGKKQCEPTSYRFRVTAPGGGTVTVKVLPATPVCEHGRMLFSAYGRG